MVTRIIIALEIAVLILGAVNQRVSASDPPASRGRDDVKLKARVALALAEADATAKARVAATAGQKLPREVAPMPREVAARPPKLTYSDGYKRASVDQQPLVIFVNCEHLDPPAGSIGSRTTCFGDTCGPAVIVGFPVGGRLYIDATLTGRELTPEVVEAAVKSAAKKIEVPAKEMPGPGSGLKIAPPPLDYQIRNAGQREVKPAVATPFPATRITPAIGVAGRNSSWTGSYPVANTFTGVPPAVIRGGTDGYGYGPVCLPGQA
jgi:hypothetical protein